VFAAGDVKYCRQSGWGEWILGVATGITTRLMIRLGPLVAFICAVAFISVCNPITGAASPAKAPAASVRYFIEFRARPSTYIGHTFIHYGSTDIDGRILESDRVGFIPEEDARKGLIFPVRGTVREYRDDTRLRSRVIYRRQLSASEFARVVVAVRQMQVIQHLWHGVFFNCNDFAIEIAEALHMRRPPSLLPPDIWVDALRLLNEP